MLFAGSQHVTPYFLFHSLGRSFKALPGVTYREVVHPAPQDRFDQFDDPIHRSGLEAAEDVPQLAQQRRALFGFVELPARAIAFYDLQSLPRWEQLVVAPILHVAQHDLAEPLGASEN